MKSRRPTQADVARRAGVSTAIVSRVLNPEGKGTVRVSPETEARVLRAIAELGYVPNPIARKLASGRARLLGVFSFESIFPLAQRDFYFPFLLGIEQGAEANAFDLLLFTSATAQGSRSIFRDGVNTLQLADGSVLLGRKPPKDELARLAEMGYPFVCLGRREVDGAEVSYIAADYAGATAEIVRHLYDLGHRTIALVAGAERDESSIDREAGYLRAMEAADLGRSAVVLRRRPDETSESDVRGLRAAGTTAVLLETDDHAHRFLDIAGAVGLSVPAEMSFAVLGDPLNPATEAPQWTSFHIPREEMGRASIEALIALIDSEAYAPYQTTLPCQFRPGDSTVPAPGPREEGP